MIYAFGHQKYCGKDSSARFLETLIREQYPKLVVQKKSFAESLKASCAYLYGWAGLRDAVYYENNPHLKDVLLPYINMSPREIWIKYGNAVRDGVHPDTFVLRVLQLHRENTTLLITDLRYPNEVKLIKALGGLCINVTRPGLPEPTDVADTALNGFKEWDYTIGNNGDLSDLCNAVKKLMSLTWKH